MLQIPTIIDRSVSSKVKASSLDICYLEHTEELLDRALFLLAAAAGLQGRPMGATVDAAAAAVGMLIMRRKRCCCLATRFTAAAAAAMAAMKEGGQRRRRIFSAE